MPSVVVVGAGCFGAWTAYQLAHAGDEVTLIDAYGPGNARASSGGETRIIRMGYGAQELYTRWSLRSLGQWRQLCQRTTLPLFHQAGVLWIAGDDDPLTAGTLDTLERVGVPHERLTGAELNARWPQIAGTGVKWAIHEPESGVLMARRAVEAVAREAETAGARYLTAAVAPPRAALEGGTTVPKRLASIRTEAGETIEAETFVFACGPWLPKLFPELLAERIFVTRQEVLYLGPPAGSTRFSRTELPAWIDFGREIYGVPDIEGRGFKISLDRHGSPFDPDSGDRDAGQTLAAVRHYVAERFPALHDAPLVGAEVCQYESTSNGDFLIDRHPEWTNVWLVGGGSGHGFKHGPAVGEYVAHLINAGGPQEPRFSLLTKDRVQQRAVY